VGVHLAAFALSVGVDAVVDNATESIEKREIISHRWGNDASGGVEGASATPEHLSGRDPSFENVGDTRVLGPPTGAL
jgi:hypothetical protein